MATIWFLSVVFLTCLLLAALKRKKQQRGPPSPPGFPIIGNLHQLGDLSHQSLWRLQKVRSGDVFEAWKSPNGRGFFL
ncbi:hypothetical protein HID58_031702 [Brassica napus]|uniref:Uncharacterized protein n=1 Tax=Brassica napus TaxID=3708 RepID=A0ABQ8BUA2_BRANA|nr:hypothetical protein HID58_031702 [Brassica napus]